MWLDVGSHSNSNQLTGECIRGTDCCITFMATNNVTECVISIRDALTVMHRRKCLTKSTLCRVANGNIRRYRLLENETSVSCWWQNNIVSSCEQLTTGYRAYNSALWRNYGYHTTTKPSTCGITNHTHKRRHGSCIGMMSLWVQQSLYSWI